MNQLILGDCLEVLRKLESESVDLVYLDPPFFSNRNYEIIWGDEGEKRSFQDRWAGGVDHYIAWLKERVLEMHRILKPTGSIFLHCDDHANAYIRVYILDKIFGHTNFINEIHWKRTTTHNNSKQGAKHFGRVADTIFFYVKDKKNYTFNPQHERYTSQYAAQAYSKKDDDGRRYKTSDLSAAKPGGETMYEWKGVLPPQGRYWAYSKENMEKFEAEGRIYYSSSGKPYLKQYLDEMPGTSVDSMWSNCVFKTKSERIGYPTQKPEALMERIIKTASNKGDTILDPFMGGGTTIAVADRLGRNWLGIDQSAQAVKVTELRVNAQQGKLVGKTKDMFATPFTVTLHKYNYEVLRNQDPFVLEGWIIGQFGGIPNAKQRSDGGLDGRTEKNQPIQVKHSENVGRNVVDNFLSAVKRYDKTNFEKNKKAKEPIGYIIAFSFGKGAIQEVARLKNSEGVTIELVEVGQIIPLAEKPRLTLEAEDLGTQGEERQIKLMAKGHSPAGVQFYAWDFSYDGKQFSADVLFDKKGKQRHAFAAGTHHIAVKVIDNEGIESIEALKIKVNGKLNLR